jgi:hypothetical protein
LSRAFVNEDRDDAQELRFDLPDPDSPHFDEAAAWALIQGANAGDSRSAELATGYAWGERKLLPEIEKILRHAEERNDRRLERLARRFIADATPGTRPEW